MSSGKTVVAKGGWDRGRHAHATFCDCWPENAAGMRDPVRHTRCRRALPHQSPRPWKVLELLHRPRLLVASP